MKIDGQIYTKYFGRCATCTKTIDIGVPFFRVSSVNKANEHVITTSRFKTPFGNNSGDLKHVYFCADCWHQAAGDFVEFAE